MEADFAASELARMFTADPGLYLQGALVPNPLNASASYEPTTSRWPKADGVLTVSDAVGGHASAIALEYKRPNEGIHGLLTAMGQAYAYLHKGYHGAAIVVPRIYPTHTDPGGFLRSSLDYVEGSSAIGVFCYDAPDVSAASPFNGRLECVRPLKLEMPRAVAPMASTPRTQWVHMREGSTTRDAFFRFLQTCSAVAGGPVSLPDLPRPLVEVVAALAPGKGPHQYIANVADDRFLSRVWTSFWFRWVATPEVLVPWVVTEGVYVPPGATTDLARDDGRGWSEIWEGRATSLKRKLCDLLNEGAIDEETAWLYFVDGIPGEGGPATQGIRARAHSYREDLDSALAQLAWIDDEGRPTAEGYRFVGLCERFGGASSAAAKGYMGATLIQTGRYGSLLHYIYRLSEATFKLDPLAFTRELEDGTPVFGEDSYWEYLEYIEDEMVNTLRVMRKVSGRARPRRRTQFQAELTLLRNYGFVAQSRYRLGVGIPIDWDRVLQASMTEL